MRQDALEPYGAGTWLLARRLDAAAWGLLFVWVGIAVLTEVSWGAGLVGVGIITIGGQLVRKRLGLNLEGFWIVVGLLFLGTGVWNLFSVRISLTPVVLIVAGAALLVSAIRARTP